MSDNTSDIHRKTIGADVSYFSNLLTHLNICRTTKFCFRNNASESCGFFQWEIILYKKNILLLTIVHES